MLIIPEIKITDGLCQETIDGQGRSDGYYLDMKANPQNLLRLLRRENAKSILINLCDQYEIESLKFTLSYFSGVTDIPLQLIADPEIALRIAGSEEYGMIARLIVDYRNYDNFDNNINSADTVLLTPNILIDNIQLENPESKSLKLKNVRLYIASHKNLEWNKNTLDNLSFLENKITLYGGISSFATLKLAASYTDKGIDSCIIGKPLFDNSFPCQSIWRNIEKEIDNKSNETAISDVVSQI